MGKLKNKVAVVLGASSINGLGGVIAKKYYDEGAKLVVEWKKARTAKSNRKRIGWISSNM